MSKNEINPESETEESVISDLTEVKLFVSSDMARAWQRCLWIVAYKTGRQRTEVMAEMVHDFLVKYEC